MRCSDSWSARRWAPTSARAKDVPTRKEPLKQKVEEIGWVAVKLMVSQRESVKGLLIPSVPTMPLVTSTVRATESALTFLCGE